MKSAYLLSLALSVGTSMAYTVHNVSVGEGALDYTPNAISAKVGDFVVFTFLSGTHGVAQASYDSPCLPYSDSTEGAGKTGLYSGLITPIRNYNPTYTIRIDTTDPIWFYCPEAFHCQTGMVGVINPGDGQSVADFSSAAENLSRNLAPAVEFGNTTVGATSPVSSPSSSSSAASSVASTSSSSSSSSVSSSAASTSTAVTTQVASTSSATTTFFTATSASSSASAATSSSASASNANIAGSAVLLAVIAGGLRLLA
ncbi:Cupredoxin [Lipomyces tetrasporus]|uniref:Cupredoxin n=1 Tax=Lipomyces tetrasporus TaxID=54092 RepID=A0AAD7QWB6_9ASCO|nr:Cupredoxin [Lipomyces tetrasporus]KAJ8102096.1 Cupredoxin [Lipomyces tetrasporus]